MAEQSVPSGTADVKIDFPNHNVLIECEKLTTTSSRSKKVEAVKDSLKRLEPAMQLGVRDADAVIALVYPSTCEETNLNAATFIEYAVLLPKHAEREIQPGTIANELSWTKAPITVLAQRIKDLDQDIGEPDALARNLDAALKSAANVLSKQQRLTLCSSLNIEAGSRTGNDIAGAKRCFLVIASAAMFHARLDMEMRTIRPHATNRPMPMSKCLENSDVIAALNEAWSEILEIDYKPVFEAACLVLNAPVQSPHFSWGIRRVVTESLSIMRDTAGLRHDLLGRIFHKILEDARFDGSFYTSTTAAVLLVGLAIKKLFSKDLLDFTVVDPACGTGTLLMATAERVRTLLGEGKVDYSHLVNSVLFGFDINLTATHMAATTLGLIAPATTFDQMNIFRAAFGVMDDGSVKAGSLELFAEDMHVPIISTSSAMSQVQTGLETRKIEKADLVIMNPPFTRDSLRHDQLGGTHERKVKEREREIFALYRKENIINFRSSGPGFLLLADFLAKPKNSTIALILPLSASMNPSTHNLRVLLANKYHIEFVVTSHDPKRFWFSENTKISEMLVVLRRRETNDAKDKSTSIVNLATNPRTVHDAHQLVEDIVSGNSQLNGVVVEWSSSRMLTGDWSGVQFFSPFLTSTYTGMRSNEWMQTTTLQQVARVGTTYRAARRDFRLSSTPDEGAMRALWHFKTEFTKNMESTTDTYIVPKDDGDNWKDVWSRRTRLLLPIKVRSNLAHVLSTYCESRTVGSYWMNVQSISESDLLDKALCVWFNSTLGTLSALAIRTPKILCYPDFSAWGIKNAAVPVLNDNATTELARVFQEFKNVDLGRWADAENAERVAMDDQVCDVLCVDKSLVAQVRYELAREPICTNRPYGT